MKTKIIKMGNSTGICIPRIILEQCHLENVVDIRILDNKIIIEAVSGDVKKTPVNTKPEIIEELCWYEDESEWK